MPCRCDYLAPTKREKESQIVCKHLQHLHRILKRPVPGDVSIGASEFYGNPNLLDAHTAMLCEMLKEHSGVLADRLGLAHIEDAELWRWWLRHKEADEKREKAERKAAAALRKKELEQLDELVKKYPVNAQQLLERD